MNDSYLPICCQHVFSTVCINVKVFSWNLWHIQYCNIKIMVIFGVHDDFNAEPTFLDMCLKSLARWWERMMGWLTTHTGLDPSICSSLLGLVSTLYGQPRLVIELCHSREKLRRSISSVWWIFMSPVKEQLHEMLDFFFLLNCTKQGGLLPSRVFMWVSKFGNKKLNFGKCVWAHWATSVHVAFARQTNTLLEPFFRKRDVRALTNV